MSLLIAMLPVLLIGTALLMAGILISREPDHPPQEALAESTVWGAGFFLSFCAEILLIDSL